MSWFDDWFIVPLVVRPAQKKNAEREDRDLRRREVEALKKLAARKGSRE